ncbi:MAG: glycerophosphodiester phosphodiesterase family protein [Polyangia bacterium]
MVHPLASSLTALALVAGCGGSAPVTPVSTEWSDPPAVAPADFNNSLGVCWTDASCTRAMIVSHGGDWDVKAPYDSHTALVRAVQRGADGIKADLRVTADNVAVITHSSPFQIYESTDCNGQYVEQMTAAQVTACHMLGSKTETFQRVDSLLRWAHGRTVVMLDVKVPTDLPRAIETAIENDAQDDLFLEVHVEDYLQYVVGAPGWEQIHYLVWLSNGPSDADALLAAGHRAQAFMYEMDPTYPTYDATMMKTFITDKLHPAGVRAFSSSDKDNPTVENHQALFDEGLDVVMTYNLTNALQVRQAVNAARGVSPP